MSQKNDWSPFSNAVEESLTYVKLDPIYFCFFVRPASIWLAMLAPCAVERSKGPSYRGNDHHCLASELILVPSCIACWIPRAFASKRALQIKVWHPRSWCLWLTSWPNSFHLWRPTICTASTLCKSWLISGMKRAQRALAGVKNRQPALWTFWPVECAYLREWNLQVRAWRGMPGKYQ